MPDLPEVVPADAPATRVIEPLSAIEALRLAVMKLDAERQTLADLGDWPSLALGLRDLNALISDLRLLAGEVEGDVVKLLPQKRVPLDDETMIERKRAVSRKHWDSLLLLDKVVRTALDPMGTGEITVGVAEGIDIVKTAIAETAPFTGSLGWRVTALRNMGIEPEDYCEVDYGREGIRFVPIETREVANDA